MHIRQYLFLLFLLLSSHVAMAVDKPLVYVDAWKRAPYVFVNDKGNPDGFNVELVRNIMERLSIPYEIRLYNQQETRIMMQKDSVDISLGVPSEYSTTYGTFGKETVCLSQNVMLVKKGDSSSVISIQHLRNMPLTVARGSRAHRYLINQGIADSLLTIVDNMETEILREVSSGKVNAVWNSMMIQWVLSKYHLTDQYTVQPVEMPVGEYKFMSKDTALLSRLDSVCRIMKQTGEIDKLTARWMSTDAMDDRNDEVISVAFRVFIGFAVLLLVIFFIRWFRKRKMHNTINDIKTLMGLTLHANHMQVWVYQPLTRHYAWMTHDGMIERQFSSFEFSKFYPEKDFNIIHSQVTAFLTQDTGPVSCMLHSYDVTNAGRTLDVEVHMEALHDTYGKIYLICGIQYDVTDSKAALTRMRQMHARYRTAFNIAFGTFMRFDAEGYLVDFNERCRTKLCIKNPKEIIDRRYNLRDFGMLHDIDLDTCADDITFSTLAKSAAMRMVIPFDYSHETEISENIHFSDYEELERYRSMSDDIYFFTHLIKSYDMKGNLLGYIMYMEDITDSTVRYVGNKHKAQQAVKLEQEANMVAMRRNYVIEKTNIIMVHYLPATKMFNIYVHDKGWDKELTQLDVLEIIEPQNMQKVFKILHRLDASENDDIYFSVSTTLKNEDGEPRHFNVAVHPVYGSDGNVESYFGIMQDITRQLAVHQRLKRETKKAREAEHLRQNFLKNMSYSIRQPLVTIQQNIDLLEAGDSQTVTESSLANITSNTRRLIKISDDTLLLSRIEARMLTEKKQRVNLVTLFDRTISESLDKYRQETVKYNISESYQELFVIVDTRIITRILQEAVSFVARHTSYGIFNARYLYRKGFVSVAIESTSQSISPSMLEHIYEPRIGDTYTLDAQNVMLSGLEMPICKALIDMIHGSIDIESDPGRGTTIYVNIPIEE